MSNVERFRGARTVAILPLFIALSALTACATHPAGTADSAASSAPATANAVAEATAAPVADSPAIALPTLTTAPAQAKGSLDIVDSLDSAAPGNVADLTLHPGQRLLLEGWAYDSNAKAPGSALIVVVDGTKAFRAQYGMPRPDVSNYFKEASYTQTGYRAVIPFAALSGGPHTIEIALRLVDGHHVVRIAKPAHVTGAAS
jgi:hypothetical protein